MKFLSFSSHKRAIFCDFLSGSVTGFRMSPPPITREDAKTTKCSLNFTKISFSNLKVINFSFPFSLKISAVAAI